MPYSILYSARFVAVYVRASALKVGLILINEFLISGH